MNRFFIEPERLFIHRVARPIAGFAILMGFKPIKGSVDGGSGWGNSGALQYERGKAGRIAVACRVWFPWAKGSSTRIDFFTE